MSLEFETAGRSVIESFRQRELLNGRLALCARTHALRRCLPVHATADIGDIHGGGLAYERLLMPSRSADMEFG